MKLFKNLHPFDLDCIYERLNDLSFRIWKLQKCNKLNTFDNLPTTRSDVHSQILKEVAHYINSVEFIPNSKYSFTINITIK